MIQLSPHPLAELFPLMQGEEFDALVDDIRRHGQREPVLLYEGQVLDGRNRVRACEVIGIEPKTRDWRGGSPIEAVVSLNLRRRHLTDSQKAACAVAIEEKLAEEARAGRAARKGKSRDAAGDVFGVSGRYVSEAKRLRRLSRAAFDRVLRGEQSLPAALRSAAYTGRCRMVGASLAGVEVRVIDRRTGVGERIVLPSATAAAVMRALREFQPKPRARRAR